MREYLQEIIQAFYKLCWALRHYPGQAVLILTAFLMYQVYTHDGTIYPGVRVVLETTDKAELERIKDANATATKVQLMVMAESDKSINETLRILLDNSGGGVRTKLGIVHNGTFTLAAQHLMHYSITHVVTAPNYSTGELSQNEPLAQWADFLPDLLDNKCIFKKTDQLRDLTAKAKQIELGISNFAACPIWDNHGIFLGAVFVSYATNPTIDQSKLLFQMQFAAARIGSALSMRAPVSIPDLP